MTSFTRKLVLASFLSLLITPALPAAYAAEQPAAPAAVPAQLPSGADVMVRVNGKNITREDVEVATNLFIPMMSYHNSVSQEKFKAIQKKALDTLIEQEAIYKYAKDNKLDKVDKKYLDKQIKETKARLPKGETLDKILERSHTTMDQLRENIKQTYVVEQTGKNKRDEFKKKAAEMVNDEYLRDYYAKNKDKFKEPEQVLLRSILIKADPSGGQKVWNESKRKAEDILKQARSGQDFAKLAEQYSQDPYAKNGGDMGWSHKGSLYPEIDDAIENLKKGEITEPVSTIYGYHLVKLEDKKESVLKKYEDLNLKKLKGELEQKETKKMYAEWIKGLKDASKIEYVTPIE